MYGIVFHCIGGVLVGFWMSLMTFCNPVEADVFDADVVFLIISDW